MSVHDLIKRMNLSEPVKKSRKGSGLLYNPDIPSGEEATNYLDERISTRDRYRNTFRSPSAPRNGTFFLTMRDRKLRLSRREKERAKFNLDNSIDPNVIRAMKNPDSAMPTMAPQAKFSLMPDSVKKSHNQVELVKRSHTSELNYKNRFMPSKVKDPLKPGNQIGNNSLIHILSSLKNTS